MPRLRIAALCTTVWVSALTAQLPTPGSVLVYPSHTTLFSIVTVTNTDVTPGASGSTGIRFDYVLALPSPNEPFLPNCRRIRRSGFLTPADTTSVLTACHIGTVNALDGYLVVSAINPASRQTWSHNYLQGSIHHISANGASWSTNAIPLSSPLREGQATDLDREGDLDFNGREYQTIPDTLSVDGFVAEFNPRLSLLNLTGSFDATNVVFISAWNDMEIPVSATRSFRCWFNARLEDVSPIFDPTFLAIHPNDPEELDIDCDGANDLETGWFFIDSINVSTPGGQPISGDGALLGSTTNLGFGTLSARSLWGSTARQANGSFSIN